MSTLKAWYGDKATANNDFAFAYLPKAGGNSSWLTIYDEALRGKMEGLMLSGMTAASIGPDSNQVLQALSNLKWLVVMDPFPTTSSEFWHAPGIDPAKVADRSLFAADDALDRERRLVHQQRPLDAVERRGSCRRKASRCTITGSSPSCTSASKSSIKKTAAPFRDPIVDLDDGV